MIKFTEFFLLPAEKRERNIKKVLGKGRISKNPKIFPEYSDSLKHYDEELRKNR